jgi:hypothetical protein
MSEGIHLAIVAVVWTIVVVALVLLTPVLFVIVGTLAATAVVVWARRSLPGLVVAAYRDYRRRQQPHPAPATEQGPR